MTLDLDKFSRRYEFDFNSEALGRLRCRVLSLDVCGDLETALADQSLDNRSFVLRLFQTVAEHPSADQTGHEDADQHGTTVTAAEAAQLSDNEIETFARAFLAHNPSLLETYEGADKEVRTNEKGERIVSITPRRIDLPKEEGERDSDYLARVMRRYLDEQQRRLSQITKPFTGLLKGFGLSKSTQDLLRENIFISDRLRGLAGAFDADLARPYELPAFHDISIPENPIEETNARINDVLNHMDELRPLAAESANLIRSMNEASIRMLSDFGRNAHRTEIYTWIIIGIAAISLFATALFSILNYTERDAAAARMERLVNEFGAGMQALSEAQDRRTKNLIMAFETLIAEQSAQERAAFIEALREAIERTAPDEAPADAP